MSVNEKDWIVRLDQKPFASHYRYFETTINHPVKKVWPHVVNIPGWMTDHRIVTLSGEQGKVGHFERVFAGGVKADVPQPHHHLYGIAEVIPYKLLALEVFAEKGGSYGDPRNWIGLDEILLVDLGQATKVIVLLMVVDLDKSKVKQKTAEEEHKEHEATRVQLENYFENLKKLVDKGGS